MKNCTGRNCPMMTGKIDPTVCSAGDCPWRTESITNADRIRARSVNDMDDLISRQAAIDALLNHYEVGNTTQNATMDDCVMIIRNLPSAQKTGAWIKMSDSDGIYYACSQCGDDIPRIAHFKPQYCPNCGAKMEDNVHDFPEHARTEEGHNA